LITPVLALAEVAYTYPSVESLSHATTHGSATNVRIEAQSFLEANSFFDAIGPDPTPRPISLADFMCFPCSAADRFRVSLLF
jgi:hypothetical protein